MSAIDADRYPGFREFVAARSVALSRTAYLLTGDTHAAEDLLQDTLARVAGRWRMIIAGGDPEPYVRRVLYTTHVSRWRRTRRIAERNEPAAERADPSDLAREVSTRLAMQNALDTLTQKQRTVLVLRYYEDLTERQAASVLGVSVSTIKGQTADALARLRQQTTTFLESPRHEVPL